MNERVFLAFRGLAILIHCFPGLGPSERHTQCVLCLLVDQKLALRWTDISREKALFLYSEITADLPHTRRLLHSPRHLPLAYSEVTPLSAQDVPPEWVYGRVYLPLAVPRFRFTYVSLDLLSRSPPYSRPFLVLPRTARCC